jgi:UDP-N-acetylmuramate: L-alanyl-gamma-D-glutamyl-meso-diaminopimelate ligase
MFSEIKSVHFTGICGTAMASAAVAMKEKGFEVTGSDQNVYPPMSTFLASRQIEVMNGYAERNLAHKPDLVVIGNAVSRVAIRKRNMRWTISCDIAHCRNY